MFKIQKPEYVNKTFRFEKSMFEELSQFAAENTISLNALVTQCCKYAMENMDQKVKQDRCIGANLRALRMEKKMTQEQVAIQMQLQGFSMSRDYYAHIENGTYNIRTSELIAFSNIFECDFNVIFENLSY